MVISHQEHIARVVTAVLSMPPDTVKAFCRGNPFDKLLRSYDEFTADRRPLYKKSLGARHYRMSRTAYNSSLDAAKLYGEHRIPLKLIIKRFLESDRSLETVRSILRANEVVLITKAEQQRLDRPVNKGGLGLKSEMPPDGSDRLEYAGIEIAQETFGNRL